MAAVFSKVLPWGRSAREYRAMFALDALPIGRALTRAGLLDVGGSGIEGDRPGEICGSSIPQREGPKRCIQRNALQLIDNWEHIFVHARLFRKDITLIKTKVSFVKRQDQQTFSREVLRNEPIFDSFVSLFS